MKINFYKAFVDYGWRYVLPSIEYRHKYWYLWEISLSWWKWSVVCEFCRSDWNKRKEEI